MFRQFLSMKGSIYDCLKIYDKDRWFPIPLRVSYLKRVIFSHTCNKKLQQAIIFNGWATVILMKFKNLQTYSQFKFAIFGIAVHQTKLLVNTLITDVKIVTGFKVLNINPKDCKKDTLKYRYTLTYTRFRSGQPKVRAQSFIVISWSNFQQ